MLEMLGFLRYQEDDEHGMKPNSQIFSKNGVIENPYLKEFPDNKDLFLSYQIRSKLVSKYAWAIPDSWAIYELVSNSPIVEIGAGTGYWASLVSACGGQIVAFDQHPPRDSEGKNHYHPDPYQWFDVQEGGPEMAANYPQHTLFLCWPPYDDDFATRTLQAYMDAGGRSLIYVGEDYGGCTADDTFFSLLKKYWEQTKFHSIPVWYGMHDAMYVYHRK